jgi:hypothetical protein
MVGGHSPKHEERRARERAPKREKLKVREKAVEQVKLGPSPPFTETSPEELEASAILERVERALADIEARTERLMHQYGL